MITRPLNPPQDMWKIAMAVQADDGYWYNFEPLTDITTHELANIMILSLSATNFALNGDGVSYQAMSQFIFENNLARHFKKEVDE